MIDGIEPCFKKCTKKSDFSGLNNFKVVNTVWLTAGFKINII